MPSVISHAVAGGSLCSALGPDGKKAMLVAALSAMVPDADALGFFAGVPYESPFGHRGFTHSFFFALIWSGLATMLLFSRSSVRWRAMVIVFLATASHPLLDMLTNGGLGVALFAPFSDERFFFPWRPIKVSPISITGFFTQRGWAVLKSELVWIWLPSSALLFAARSYRRRTSRP